jgi:hypothetical protein
LIDDTLNERKVYHIADGIFFPHRYTVSLVFAEGWYYLDNEHAVQKYGERVSHEYREYDPNDGVQRFAVVYGWDREAVEGELRKLATRFLEKLKGHGVEVEETRYEDGEALYQKNL